MPKIKDAKVLILSTYGFEQSELEVPRDKLREAGATVVVATPDGEDIKGWKGGDWGETVKADASFSEVTPADFDALVLPGGQMNPDILRVNDDALTIVRSMLTNGQTIAAICHAPWLLVQVDALKGREATSYHSIKKDVENAGAIWKDESVVTDNGIITSRNPNDLEDFVAKIIEEIEEGRHHRKAA